MKRQYFLTLILASFFIVISLHGSPVQAQTSISGDSVCGAWDPVSKKIINPCGVQALQTIAHGVFSLIIVLGLPLLVVFIIYRFIMAWYALQQGNANAYKEAGKKATEAITGFIIIVALFGGLFLVVLKYFGVQDFPLQLLKAISDAFIPHAYAQTTLPSPTVFTSLYDFILGTLNVVMKFFLYPALIGIWVWSGFSYVLAQGAPEKLKKAHNLLIWAFISTLIVFMTQGFLVALRGSVNKILPATASSIGATATANTTADPVGTLDGRATPLPGEVGSVCTLPSGGYGQVAVGGDCVSGGRR